MGAGDFDGLNNRSMYQFELYDCSSDAGALNTECRPVPLENCGVNFPTQGDGRFSDFICPSTYDLEIQGNLYSQVLQHLIMVLRKWTGSTCSPVEDFPNDIYIQFVFMNGYFDPEDYTTPNKTFLDARYQYSIFPSNDKRVTFFLRQDEVNVYDTPFQFGQGYTNLKLVKMNRVESDIAMPDEVNFYFQGAFRMDYEYEIHERTVESIFDFFGNLGGSFGFVVFAAGIIVFYVASRLKMYSLISNLYQVDMQPLLAPVSRSESYMHSSKPKMQPEEEKKKEEKATRHAHFEGK